MTIPSHPNTVPAKSLPEYPGRQAIHGAAPIRFPDSPLPQLNLQAGGVAVRPGRGRLPRVWWGAVGYGHARLEYM